MGNNSRRKSTSRNRHGEMDGQQAFTPTVHVNDVNCCVLMLYLGKSHTSTLLKVYS